MNISTISKIDVFSDGSSALSYIDDSLKVNVIFYDLNGIKMTGFPKKIDETQEYSFSKSCKVNEDSLFVVSNRLYTADPYVKAQVVKNDGNSLLFLLLLQSFVLCEGKHFSANIFIFIFFCSIKWVSIFYFVEKL